MSKEEFIKKIAAYIKKYAPCGSHSGKKTEKPTEKYNRQ